MKSEHRAIYSDQILAISSACGAILELIGKEGAPTSQNALIWAIDELRRLMIRRSVLDHAFLGLQFGYSWDDPEIELEEEIRAKKLFSSGSQL